MGRKTISHKPSELTKIYHPTCFARYKFPTMGFRILFATSEESKAQVLQLLLLLFDKNKEIESVEGRGAFCRRCAPAVLLSIL